MMQYLKFVLLAAALLAFVLYELREYLSVLLISVVGFAILLLAGVPLWWRGYKSVNAHRHEHKDRQAFRALLEAATIQVRSGYNLEFSNPQSGVRLKLTNPFITTSRISERKVEEVIDNEIEIEAHNKEIPVLLPPLLTFAQLLEQGIIQNAIKQGKMSFGYYADTHELRFGTWEEVYSVGNGGVSGSGKSTTTRFLLFQAALAGAKFIFIDPHIGDPDESLAAQFSQLPASIHLMKPCDGKTQNVLKRVQWLAKELERRKLPNSQVRAPIVFVIDEFNEQMRNKEVREELSTLLLDIEQGGRKFGIFALLIGQRWSSQDLGGADIRTSLASKMAHRFSDEDQAKRFMGSKYGKQLLELETGHWLFYDTKGKTTEMITPHTVANDGRIISEILTSETSVKVPEDTHVASSVAQADLSTYSLELTPESTLENTKLAKLAHQVVLLQAEGLQKADIMRRIWGVNPGGSEDYKKAIVEYQNIMQYIATKIGV